MAEDREEGREDVQGGEGRDVPGPATPEGQQAPEKLHVALILIIEQTTYYLSRLAVDPPVKIGWELQKAHDLKTKYHVSKDGYGLHCDCPDSIFRGRENQPPERQCKHVRAMRELHLV